MISRLKTIRRLYLLCSWFPVLFHVVGSLTSVQNNFERSHHRSRRYHHHLSRIATADNNNDVATYYPAAVEQAASSTVDASSSSSSNEPGPRRTTTPFQIFNDHVMERIDKSDRQGIDQLSENVDAIEVLQPIVRWSEIERLASSTEATNEERAELAHRFHAAGGYLLLELEEDQASIVQDMWASLSDFFEDRKEDKNNNDGGDGDDDGDGLHHQTIAREGDAHETLGYKFVQTYNTPGDEVLPTTIQDALKKNNSPSSSSPSQRGGAVADSFLLFAEIASQVASVLAAGALDEDPQVMQAVVDGLLHSSTTRFASANHRLSRYVLTESETNPLKESLRAHTDWTLTTPIPLSATPGLQLWKPQSQQWIAPEALVPRDLPLPRTRYVVVLAGKWIELLTNQKVLSCIHRVVTQTSQEARLSAPFFLRPKEFVFESLASQFNDPEQVVEDMSTEEAMTRIHSMFHGFIDLTKSFSSRTNE